MRHPHYLPSVKANEMPCNCIWVDTETKGRKQKDGSEKHYLWFGWACYMRRERGKAWSHPEWKRFKTINEFWTWALSKARKKTRLYLFAHNGAFDLPVLHAFSELPKRGYELKSAVVDAPPMILTWKCPTGSIRFIDTLNIWRVPLKSLGKSIGLEKLPMPPKDASKLDWDTYGQRDTDIIRVACLEWFDFLVDNDLGGFAPTLASQAFCSYRHRFMPQVPFIDANEKALDLARDSYLGGRTECFRIGKYEGEFYYLDFNSMYPAVMRTTKLPYKLVSVYNRPTDDEINKWIEHFAVVADCLLETEQPIYPTVYQNKLVFPVGEFRATLSTPEFICAWERGHVKSIERIALYEQDYLFKDFVDFFYTKRLEATAEGNEGKRYSYKILMNSLYGKFGQRGRNFETIGESEPNEIAVWDEIDFDTREIFQYRKFGGIVQQKFEEGESRHSHPAIASHVTSAARQILWGAIEAAGPSHIYYCDTDSVVVDKEGLAKVQHLIDEKQLGALKLEKTLKTIELFGPKDYIFDGDKKTKGVRATAKWLTASKIQQDKFTGFKGLLRLGSLDAPIVETIEKNLYRHYTKGTVLKSGRIVPLRFDTTNSG